MLKGESFKYIAIMTVIALTIIGRITYIPVTFQVAIHTILLVYIGCVFSVKVLDIKKEREVEVMDQKDALLFPVFGSAILLGLFLVFKYFNKDMINVLFHYYFSVIGAYTISCFISERLVGIPVCDRLSQQVLFTIPPIKFITDKESKISMLDIFTLAIGSVIGLAYFFYKNWTLNNILGIAFSIFGIENIMLGQFKVGFILLGLLFFYDIFWVFGTPVMVEVAKSLDGPIKLMFPKAIPLEDATKGFNMIGLGDIVIPGIYVALMLRYDIVSYFRKNNDAKEVPFSLSNCKYFIATMLGYTAGIVTTLFIMVVFQAAQPALLYLVPGCLLSSLLVAVFTGDLKNLWGFSEEAFIEELKAKAK